MNPHEQGGATAAGASKMGVALWAASWQNGCSRMLALAGRGRQPVLERCITDGLAGFSWVIPGVFARAGGVAARRLALGVHI